MSVNLNPTDKVVLDYLTEGRVTANHIAEQAGEDRGNINNRLLRLVELGYVEKISRGLYELKDDPRED